MLLLSSDPVKTTVLSFLIYS